MHCHLLLYKANINLHLKLNCVQPLVGYYFVTLSLVTVVALQFLEVISKYNLITMFNCTMVMGGCSDF